MSNLNDSERLNLDKMIKEYDADKHTFNGPNILKTNNNGLMYTADILEEIYTNRDFPKNTKKME